jgi:putative phage-type endonuclease
MLSADQRKLRMTGIGASESPCLVGLSPFGTPITVWCSKHGIDLEDETDAMKLGNYLEEGIAQMYSNDTGRVLGQFGTIRHREFPWMMCTPDRAVFGERRIVQIKLVGPFMASHWDNGIPAYVEIQVQHEMEVCDVDVCDVAVCIGGTDYKCMPVERDRELGMNLVTICKAFWDNHVLTGEMPEVDGTEASSRALKALYKKPKDALAEATDEAAKYAADWFIATKQYDEAKAAKELATQRLKKIIGVTGAVGIAGAEFIAKWKPRTDGVRVFTCEQRGKRRQTEAA